MFTLLVGCTSNVPVPTPSKAINASQTASPTRTANPNTITPAISHTPILSPALTPANSDTPFPTATLPVNCGTVELGTPGTQGSTDNSAPPVLVQGTAILCINRSLFSDQDYATIVPFREAMLDLDSGNVDVEMADIAYYQSGTMDFDGFLNVNGASVELWTFYIEGTQVREPPQPTYEQCKQRLSQRTEEEPVYLCVITNNGHVARVKGEQFSPLQGISSIKISFVTWNDIVVQP